MNQPIERLHRITQWGDPSAKIASGYGRISEKEWCERECARLIGKGDHVRMMHRADGWVALGRFWEQGVTP